MLPSQQGQHGLRLVMVGGFWMPIPGVGSVLRLLGES